MEITFKRFGKLVAISYHSRGKWLFLCDCGERTIRGTGSVKNPNYGVNGCGCFNHKKKHGESGTKLYDIWSSMKARCNRKTCKDYLNYGGRGISYFNDWENYATFKEWSVKANYKEGLTLERIDVNGDYHPNNCEWIENELQARNRRNTHLFEMNGEIGDIRYWSEKSGIPYFAMRSRLLNYKWDISKATSEPVKK